MASIEIAEPSNGSTFYKSTAAALNLTVRGQVPLGAASRFESINVSASVDSRAFVGVGDDDGRFTVDVTIEATTSGSVSITVNAKYTFLGRTGVELSGSAKSDVLTVTVANDVTAPSVTIQSPERDASISIPEEGGSLLISALVKDAELGVNTSSVKWSLDDGSIGGSLVSSGAPDVFNATLSWPATLEVPGSHKIEVSAADNAVPTHVGTAKVTFWCEDSNAPLFEINSPQEIYRLTQDQSLRLDGIARDRQSGLARLESMIDGEAQITVEKTWVDPDLTKGMESWSLEIPSSRLKFLDKRKLHLFALDGRGNSRSKTAQIEVLQKIVPVDAGDLIGLREYLRALLAFGNTHVRVSNNVDFVDDALLSITFAQRFEQLATSLSSLNASPVTQARLCVEILRSQFSQLPGFDSSPPAKYLVAAYDSVLRNVGTSYEELRLVRGAATDRRLALTRRLGIGDDTTRLDRLLLRPGHDLTEDALQRLFNLRGTAASGGTSQAPDDGVFFEWQRAQRHSERAAMDRELPYLLIDPDVIGKADLAGDAASGQFILLSARKAALEQRESELRALLSAKRSLGPIEALVALMADALGFWAPASQVAGRLETLVRQVDQQGQGIDSDLAALWLDMSSLRRLVHVIALARSALDWNDLDEREIDDVIQILVRVWKLQKYLGWRREETEQSLAVSPQFFQLYLDTPPALPNSGFNDGAAIPFGNDATGWTLTGPPGAPLAGPAKVARTTFYLWLPNGNASLWISPTADGAGAMPVGEYVYVTEIDFDGWDLSTVELVARISADNSLTAISITSPDVPGVTRRIDLDLVGYEAFSAVSINSADLFSGVNRLAFHVLNGATTPNPTGFRVEFLFSRPPSRLRASGWRWAQPSIRSTAPPVLDTGGHGTRVGEPDPAWRITAAPSPTSIGPAVVSSTVPAAWFENGDSARSRWISPLADGGALQPEGDFEYESVLDLTGWTLDDFVVELRIAADEALATVLIITPSGHRTNLSLSTGPDKFNTLTIKGPLALEAGRNLFRIKVRNPVAGPTGLRAELSYATAPKLRSWSAAPALRGQWQTLLASRLDDEAACDRAAANILRATEQAVLPLFRDDLINRFARRERLSPSEAAEWLGQRYLMETRGDAWRLTTRVQQATESLQTLFTALREKRLPRNHPAIGWQIGPDTLAQYDQEWVWIGSYSSWRSATLIFYFPENLLLPSLRPIGEQTLQYKGGFLQGVRGPVHLSPAKAQLLADEYIRSLGGAIPAIKLLANRSDDELQAFRLAIWDLWRTSGNPYLDEVLWSAPMTLAIQLQRSGEYEAALDWYRTVYAYQAPNDETRKIFPGLREEHNGAPTLNQQVHWLREALDPHSFARQRWPLGLDGKPPAEKNANPYTRYTMMCIARCMLEFGDAEFTRDSGESLANARGLYLAARDLLSRPDFDLVQPTSPDQVLLPNPVLEALRWRVENQLRKMRQGRNAAGMKRDIELPPPPVTLTGAPSISSNGNIVLQGDRRVDKATPYRFSVLMDRAKQLVGIAQQMEGAYLAALERIDVENYSLKRANHDLKLATAGFELQKLRVTESMASKSLFERQKQRAAWQQQAYQNWIDQGWSASEKILLASYQVAAAARETAAIANAAYAVGQLTVDASGVEAAAKAAPLAAATVAKAIESVASVAVIAADATAQVSALLASHERQVDQWMLGRGLAVFDELIIDQQIVIANDHINVANQEKAIAELQNTQATDVANFLADKFTNTELYEWMSGVLSAVYAYFLQQASSVALLAQQQLGFERQESPGSIIQDDYWEIRSNAAQSDADSAKKDRRGLTGSARLLQDIYQLDQFAFESNKRKLNLSHTMSLAQLFPQAFEQFRDSGVFSFTTTAGMFDELFPGHYLRLIKRVRTTVVALIPPISGIRATLRASGVSYVVTGGDTFQEVTIRRDPEAVALSSPTNATGVFDLDAQTELLMPFESMGVATSWEFSLPKAANAFDFDSIADIYVTLEYTALNDNDYRQQVIQRLPRQTGFNRAYSVRKDFPDNWYSLCNPIESSKSVLRYRSERSAFPSNLDNVMAKDIILALITDVPSIEGDIELKFHADGLSVPVAAHANLIDNRISSATSAPAWRAAIALRPAVGTWEFALPKNVVSGIAEGIVKDILLIHVFTGVKPTWPAM